ncbi:MAG: hypothetical protein LBR27_11155 [Bifidobacteriaceae bacterium]|nr:hypothetical protein [Bifidobacteriaceae bacterium]
MAHLSRYARQAAPAELEVVVLAWQQDVPFWRRLTIHLARVAGRPDLVRPLVTDPVLGPAAVFALVALDDAAHVAAGLANLPYAHRCAFYRALRRHRAEAVADGAIGPVLERFGGAEAARLLPACSVDVAAQHLPDLMHLMGREGQPSLAGLARRAPELVAGAIEEYLRPFSDYLRASPLAEFSAVLEVLAEVRPDLVFDIIGQRLTDSVPPMVVRHLAKADAPRVAELLAGAEHKVRLFQLTRATARQLVRGGAAGLLAPAMWRQQRDHNSREALRRLLQAIPPSQRVAAIGAGTIEEVPLNKADLVALLPVAQRQACARRQLERLSTAELAQRHTWQWLLPLAEQDEAWAMTHHPDPPLRGGGYRLLLKSAFAERQEAAVVGLLDRFTRLTNEQDPVREEVAGELAAGWRGKPVPAAARDWLGRFIDAVRDARDTSGRTVGHLYRLVKEALNQAGQAGDQAGVDWALDQLDKQLATGVGTLDPVGLSRQALDLAWPRLAGWLKRWPDHMRLSQIRQLHRLRRPEIWDRTAPFLRPGAREHGRLQSWGVNLYLDDPRHRDERVAELVKVDPSVGYYDPCSRVIAARRTDLLDPYLKAKPVSGHFSKQSTFFLAEPRVAQCCWLPRQQAACLQALTKRMFATKNLPAPWPLAASLAAALTSAGPEDRLAPYLAAKDVFVVEAGLAALPGAGDPEAAAVRLLQEAETDRALVAFYALFPVLARLTPDKVAALFQPFLAGKRPAKVTSLKALVYLVEALRLPAAVPSLLALTRLPGLHHHVTYAAVAQLAHYLDQPAVVDGIRAAEANTSPHSVLEAVFRGWQWDLPLAGRQALAGLAADMLVADSAVTRQSARLEYQRLATWDSRGLAVLAAQTVDPAWDEWQASAESLGIIAGWGTLDGVEDLCASLVTRAEAEIAADSPPSTENDLPSLRRLEAILDRWRSRRPQPASSQAALLRVTARLGQGPLAPLGAWFLVRAAFDANPPHVVPELFDAAAALCPPWLAARLSVKAASIENVAPSELLPLVQRHAAGDKAGLVVELAAEAGPAAGWSPEWLDVLATLRRHPDRAVREAALWIDARSTQRVYW